MPKISYLTSTAAVSNADVLVITANTSNTAVTRKVTVDSFISNIPAPINLFSANTAQLQAIANTSANGDIAFCTDGDAGSPCVAVKQGNNWLKISLGANVASS